MSKIFVIHGVVVFLIYVLTTEYELNEHEYIN